MNKNTILAILATGLICAGFLTACNDAPVTPLDRTATDSTIESEPEKAHFTFVEHSQSTPNAVTSEDKEIVYILSSAEKVSFVAENRADRESSRKINDVLATAYDRSRNLYAELYPEVYELAHGENADPSSLPWETKVDYSCTRNDGKAISVTEVIETYAGGALIGSSRFSYNFDPITGDQIRNIFYIPGDKASFDEADNTLYQKLLAKYGAEVIDYENVSASFIDESLDCWRFTENGAVVTLNAGSVAGSEAGVLEVEYTKEELPELAQKYFN